MKKMTIADLNVLLIEDDRHMRVLIRNVLMALGVKDVAEASDGGAAIEELKSFRPNLILCDMRMTPMGGLKFVRALRANRKTPFRLVPVIMVTAYADLESVGDARDVGVTEFMAKPISAADLEKRIQRVLNDVRRFVESPEFTGPDRRRGKKVAFGGKDRRETEPTFIEPPEPSPSPEPAPCKPEAPQ